MPAPLVRRALLALGAGAIAARAESPVAKVVQLLTDLKAEVTKEGKDEAKTYDEFACFCKDTTATKSTAITDGQDQIDSLAADIEENTATKGKKAKELKERKKKQEELADELDETAARCEKEEAEYEEQAADLTKAETSLGKAVKTLEKSKPALLQEAASKEIRDSVALAEILGFGKSSGALQAFLQQAVDPKDPKYKFHSSEVLNTLKSMHEEFKQKKEDVDSDFEKSKSACTEVKTSLAGQMEENGGELSTLQEAISGLEEKIAKDRGSLVEAKETLEDDQLYLKDLTARCETAAKDWDQRSQGRSEELKALTEALAVLTEAGEGKKSVAELDKVNDRGDFVQLRAPRAASHSAAAAAAPSLLQRAVVQAHRDRPVALRGSKAAPAATARAAGRSDRAAEALRGAAARLKSATLTSMAARVKADPFKKVKGMIQQLIERLLEEGRAEASKQGFCDTAVGKAVKDREHRMQEAKSIAAELKMLNAKKDELNQTMDELKEDIPKLYDTLNQTQTQREEEKTQNLETIKMAKEGRDAVKRAISVLKAYYKRAMYSKVLLQASPVDDDTQGPGFMGAYRGKQAGANSIVDLLETIVADFAETVESTQQAEDTAQREFVELEQTSKEDISAKETSLELTSEDLKATKKAIEEKVADLETSQGLVDKAIQAIEDLEPMCNAQMSYAERQEKREEEIAALRSALCILDPKSKEEECGGAGKK